MACTIVKQMPQRLVDPVDPSSSPAGFCVELRAAAGGLQHLLDGCELDDGDPLEMMTADGWVTGHYRAILHPETGQSRFDMHVKTAGQDGSVEHVALWLPERALLRRRV